MQYIAPFQLSPLLRTTASHGLGRTTLNVFTYTNRLALPPATTVLQIDVTLWSVRHLRYADDVGRALALVFNTASRVCAPTLRTLCLRLPHPAAPGYEARVLAMALSLLDARLPYLCELNLECQLAAELYPHLHLEPGYVLDVAVLPLLDVPLGLAQAADQVRLAETPFATDADRQAQLDRWPCGIARLSVDGRGHYVLALADRVLEGLWVLAGNVHVTNIPPRIQQRLAICGADVPNGHAPLTPALTLGPYPGDGDLYNVEGSAFDNVDGVHVGWLFANYHLTGHRWPTLLAMTDYEDRITISSDTLYLMIVLGQRPAVPITVLRALVAAVGLQSTEFTDLFF